MTLRPVFIIWWLREADYSIHQNNLPPYISKLKRSRQGRPGRGRLWVPPDIAIKQLKVSPGHPMWNVLDPNYGGLVIHAKDGTGLAGGILTTLTLQEISPKELKRTLRGW